MATSITFTLQDGFYTSDDISASGFVRVHLNFVGKSSRVILETSIEPTDGYAVFSDTRVSECVFEKSVPLVEGQVLRIRCSEEPSSALTDGTI